MTTLLVIDDEPNVRYSLQKALQTDQLQVVGAGTAREGLETIRNEPPDAVILDLRLPDQSGLDAHDAIHKIDPRLPVIIITAHGTTDTAIEAIKRGAFEYLIKPVDLHQLRDVIERALELSRLSRVTAVIDEAQNEQIEGDRIVGRSAIMQDVYKSIGRVAPLDVTVLILGESGTGKELIARAVYQHSRRSQAPFLAINCAAIPDALLESELFGHERGSFTSADRRRIGKFEQAAGGTIFLDEIGDMSAATQSKLLRLLQERQFERVGGNVTMTADVRIIAATNQDLEGLVAAGRFRQDLFYRLDVFNIRLPPLRDRLEDLPLLVDYFVKRFNRDLSKSVHSLSPEVVDVLRRHPWPGNIRELQSTLRYALVHAAGDALTVDCLPDGLRALAGRPIVDDEDAEPNTLDVASFVRDLLAHGQPEVYHTIHTEVDRVLIAEALRRTKGNQVEAAQLLGVSRNTLRARMRSLGLAVEKQLAPESGQDAQ